MQLLRSISLLAVAAHALLVPSPPGTYAVAVEHFELIDTQRIDRFAPQPNTTRRFMASVYLPIHAKHHCKNDVVPYMPALTATVFSQVGISLGLPDGLLEQFEMEFCNLSSVKLNAYAGRKQKSFPVAIFSPGAAGSRLLYGAMARSLASLGNIVFTVDHTYETQVVKFPDGTAAFAANVNASDNAVLLEQLEARTKDVSFLASQLSNKTFTSTLFASFPGTFKRQVAVFGHSFGGSTAITTASKDRAVIGGVNLDGTVLGDVNAQGLRGKSFIFVASTRNETKDFPILPYWNDLYPKINAAKMQLAVRDTQHYAFLDIPLLLAVYQLPPAFQPAVDEVFGTLDGRRVEKAVNDIMTGLLELLFHDDVKPLEKVDNNGDVEVILNDLRECA